MKTWISILLFSLACNVEAQESHLSNTALSEGRYQINASFQAQPKSPSAVSVVLGLDYFVRNDISVDGYLSASAGGSESTVSPGLGGSYYFLKGKTIAPFVAQKFWSTLDNNDTFSSETSFGSLVLLSPNIGFKPSANFGYNFKSKSRSFDVFGSFTFIY